MVASWVRHRYYMFMLRPRDSLSQTPSRNVTGGVPGLTLLWCVFELSKVLVR
jgi:hypothetical protein